MIVPREEAALPSTHPPGGFRAWPWLVAAVALVLVSLIASPKLVEGRLPAAARHYAAFVIDGIAIARVCLLACAALSALTALALKRWGGLVECRPSRAGSSRLSPFDRLILCALVLAALALRVPTIGASLWMDEMNTVVRVIDKGLLVILAFSSEGNNHLMNSLLMYLCEKLLGETEWVLRLPVLLMGALTPAAIFLCLRRLLPSGAALVAAILALVHFRYVEFSANARGYAGVILCSAIALCLFAEMRSSFRWRLAVAYIAAAAGTAAFVPTTLYVAVAHGMVAAFALAAAWRRGAPRRDAARAGAVLGACGWAVLLALSANSLLIPQLIDYARHGAELAHKHMGVELATGIAYFMSGSSRLLPACLVLLLSAIGFVRYRHVPHLLVALLAPLALYAGAVTAFGMRTSPRLYVQFIFPCIAGFALFLYSEWRKPRAAGRVAVFCIAAVFLIDSVPQFQRFYFVSNPPLKPLARRLQGAPVMLIGDQADLNSYYFHGAAAVFPHEMDHLRERIVQTRPKYLVAGIDCIQMERSGGLVKVATELGYRPLERFLDWTYGEQAGPSERQPCFLLLTSDAVPAEVGGPRATPRR
jgi:hypothetical protein